MAVMLCQNKIPGYELSETTGVMVGNGAAASSKAENIIPKQESMCMAVRQLHLSVASQPFRERLRVQILSELVKLKFQEMQPLVKRKPNGAVEWNDTSVCGLLSKELGLTQYNVVEMKQRPDSPPPVL